MELQLDRLKQKGAVKRALFLRTRQPVLDVPLQVPNGAVDTCREMKIYLRVSPDPACPCPWLLVAAGVPTAPVTPLLYLSRTSRSSGTSCRPSMWR